MARKPRSEWSESYRKRIESAERRGLTGAARRGHHAGEYQERKQKLKAAHKLNHSQQLSVATFAEQQAKRSGASADKIYDDMLKWLDGDFEKFKTLKKWRDKKITQRKKLDKKTNSKTRKSKAFYDRAALEDMLVDLGIDPENEYWLYYGSAT